MSAAEQYVEYLFLNGIFSVGFDELAGGEWLPKSAMRTHFNDRLKDSLLSYGYSVGDQYIGISERHFEGMIGLNVIETEGDEYTGSFARFEISKKDSYIRSALRENAVASRIEKLGRPALQVALAALAEELGWLRAENQTLSDVGEPVPAASDQALIIPASDRFVTLGHNQQEELDQASNDLIEALEKENSVDGDPSARAWMLGQLKAGRELIRAQVLNAWLLEQTLLGVLKTLMDKFKDHAIGSAAKALVDLLIKYLFGGP